MVRILKLIALILVTALTLTTLNPILAAATETSSPPALPQFRAYVEPALLDPATYVLPVLPDNPNALPEGYFKAMEIALSKGSRLREGHVKAVIVGSPSLDVESLESKTRGIIGVLRLPTFTYVEAWVSRGDIEELSRTPGVYQISPFRAPLSIISMEREIMERAELGSFRGDEAIGAEPTIYKAVEVMGASRVWEEFGLTGKNVVVAVVDTGVDFGSPGLGSKAVARTPEGTPMIFDSDEIGLTLTLATSTRDAKGFISIPAAGVPYFDGWFLAYGVTKTGWVYYSSPTGKVFYAEFPLDKFYVGDISSASGVYRFGLAIQFYAVYGTLYWSVPILYVDSKTPGVYDTVYADLSTMYYYLLVALNATGVIRAPPESAIRALRDFSFADEKPAKFGDEVLARDFTGDGVNDISIGALAGYLYDWVGFLTGEAPTWSWLTGFDYTGRVLPGLDSRGFYVTIAYDFHSHGSSVANVIASRLETPVDLRYGKFPLKGVAPGALIAANTGLVNPIASVIFFSGFDLVDRWEWRYTGRHKADIISNSWGSSFILLLGFASTISIYGLIWDHLISTSGTIIVHAGGNGAPGYGTMTTPGDSAFAITLGASTLFDYRPYFGFLPGTWDDVVSWSARGPTNVGLVKPDVVNIGSFAWTFTHTLAGLGSGIRAISLFGGTSEATPMTSGAVALIVEYLKSKGLKVDPGFVKSLLKSAARDLGYDAYTQGAGHVDVYKAVRALEHGGIPIATSTSVAENLYAMAGLNSFYYPVYPVVADAQLYTGPVKPGDTKTLALNLMTSPASKKEVSVELSLVTFQVSREGLVKYLDLDKGYAIVAGRVTPLSAVLVDLGPDYITIKMVRGLSRIMVPISMTAFEKADTAEIAAWVSYSVFDPLGRSGAYAYFLYPGLELHYGVDANNDGFIAVGETQRINYDIRIANVLHATIGKPLEKFKLAEEQAAKWLGRDITGLLKAPMLDLRIIATRHVDVPVTFKLELRKHVRVEWDWISFDKSSVTLKPGETFTVNVKVNVPSTATPGLYEGYVVLKYGSETSLVPVSVPVAAVITSETRSVVITGWQDYSYNNYAVEGQFDWGWRYESADWRSFPVIVEDPSVAGYAISLTWRGMDSTFDVGIAGLGLTLLTTPSETLFYGAVYAAKLNWPPYYPSHGIQAIYDSPIPKRAALFATDFSFILERLGFFEELGCEGRPPFWVIVKNIITEASDGAGYPERFLLTIIPVRVEAPTSIDVSKDKPTDIRVRVYGSSSLSRALVFGFVAEEGAADVYIEPQVLGIGSDHTFKVTVVAKESSIVMVGLVLPYMPQISIGFNFAGAKQVIELSPGIIIIPIAVNVK
ncbi:MAG: S8 family serine peptidase [Thermoprotei archaeon]|nr:S8 family serine peptidase [Thermoprotei archaeon]